MLHSRLFIAVFCAWYALANQVLAVSLTDWNGPVEGPRAQIRKEVVFLASDYKNRSIGVVYRGFQTAAKTLGWTFRIENAQGQLPLMRKQLAEAIQSRPAAIVIAGFSVAPWQDLIQQAREARIVLVGWHAGAFPGPDRVLFSNITANNSDVASMAVSYVVAHGRGPRGVVILTDEAFDIARYKVKVMRRLLDSCDQCRVLAVESVPIAQAASMMPDVVHRLNAQFGTSWTHTLAINDVYFDHMNFPLLRTNRFDLINVTAGDGSANALRRIKGGRSQQAATVAEPLRFQGWQLVDELNRAFAGREPSGFVSKPLLVTHEMLNARPNAEIEDDSAFEAGYRRIWFGPELSAR